LSINDYPKILLAVQFISNFEGEGRAMKIFSAVLILSVFLLSSCTGLTPSAATPMPQPMPTATPDPCSAENIVAEVEDLQALVNSFQDGMNIANNTDVNLLIHPILRLQELQEEIRRVKVPTCLAGLKETSIQYSISVINYLLIFMNTQDPNSEDLATAIQTSQQLWQEVIRNFNSLLPTSGLTPQELPELNQAIPDSESSGYVLINEGPGSVNLRAAPNLNAEVLAALSAGSQAQVLGKNEAGDWVQVDFNGMLGWIFAETVTINVPIEDLPVIEVVP
jgi:hypothetical protein